MEFEGFIATKSCPQITIDQEGQTATLTITSLTSIMLNEQTANCSDLEPGDKTKAKYDPNTNDAIQLMIER